MCPRGAYPPERGQIARVDGGVCIDSLRQILFFDGQCAFCNRAVRWVLRHDRRGTLSFAPLQGETYARIEIAAKPTDVSSLVLVRDGQLYTLSSATVRMLRAMGGIWSGLGTLLWLVPKPLRDCGYRLVAKHRFRIAGKADPASEACMMPTDASRARMLP